MKDVLISFKSQVTKTWNWGKKKEKKKSNEQKI